MARGVGVDVGGTGVRAAEVVDGAIGPIRRVPLDDRHPDAVEAAILRAVGDPRGHPVGIGVPGFVADGVVRQSPNFPSWRDVDLAGRLAGRFGAVTVINDANAAAVGAWHRLGRPEVMVLVTLGTGVGGGIVAHGRALLGARGFAGELGHLPAGGDARCGCGAVGCLETVLGTQGLVRRAQARGHTIAHGADLVAAASSGDAWAVEVLDEAGEALGRTLVSVAHMVNPSMVAIAGGMVTAQRWLEPGVRRGLSTGIEPIVEGIALRWLGRADPLAIVGSALHAIGRAT